MKELYRFRQFLAEGIIKEELTWYVEDENEDVRFQNDAYLKEVGRKIKEIHPDISSEDLNKIISMTGEQYSREEDFHGDSIPSGNFVKAAVEIYQTDVLGSEDDEDFDEWAPENLDGDFPKRSIFAGWTQAQYDAYQEEPRKYEKYLGGGSFNLAEGIIKENIDMAVINSHDDYYDLYIGNKAEHDAADEEEQFSDEYMIDLKPGMYQMIYWNDEGPDYMNFDNKLEYVKETISGFWGEDYFIEEFGIEDLMDAAGDNWGSAFDKHLEDNLDMYYEKLNEFINNSYPDGDSASGVVLLVNGKVVAGEATEL